MDSRCGEGDAEDTQNSLAIINLILNIFKFGCVLCKHTAHSLLYSHPRCRVIQRLLLLLALSGCLYAVKNIPINKIHI